LRYLHYALSALCAICKMRYLHYALSALCAIRTLRYLRFAISAFCRHCLVRACLSRTVVGSAALALLM
jgi:hypothetical protein